MKGIRKLFLGLIFMTLIGVGFKVDVKAADVPADSITAITIGEAPTDWSSGTAKVRLTFNFNDQGATSVFPVQDADDNVATFTVKKGTTPVKNFTVTFRNKTGELSKVKVADGEFVDKPTSNELYYDIPFTKAEIKALLDADGKVTLTFNNEKAVAGAQNKTRVIEAYSVTLTAKSKTESGTIRDITTGAAPKHGETESTVTQTSNPFYLLPGEKQWIGVGNATVGGFRFNKWEELDINWQPYEITMGTANKTINALYLQNPDGLKIPTLTSSGTDVVVDENSAHFSYTTTYGTQPVKNYISKAYIGSKEVFKDSDADYIWFKGSTVAGRDQTLKFVMTDGAEYSFSGINVINIADTKIEFNPKAYSTSPNSPVTMTLVTYGATPKEVTYSFSPNTGITSEQIPSSGKKGTQGVRVTGTSALSSVTVTATATYDDIGGTSIPDKTATATLSIQSLTMKSDLFVNKGHTVNLSDFISSGSKDSTVSITNNASSYVETSATSGVLKNITVKGKSSGTADKEKFIVEGNKMKVTCYPEPALSVETTSGSSSSGSYTYSYHVTMPKGVYYGDDTDVWVSDLKKAILIIKGSGDDPKKKEIVLDSDWKDESDKISMKVTKKLDVKTLTGYLRDIGKKDEESFKVYACAVNGKGNNDDKIKTEEKEIKAYKIALDTNGGKTSYTVNGDACYDYFYKIDGVEYTVVARGTGTLDKKNSVNADNATTSSGTATIVLGSSGAGVLGERKIKAAFTGSNTANDSTDGGDGGDGYDEVPKTGESKADIWILWTVLFISILGAGFMIWKRFGLVRAIAEAEQEQAYAEHEEQVKAEKKAKEDKLNMLKDLRNL